MTDQQNIIAESFSNIHAIITRGLKTSIESVQAFGVGQPGDETRLNGLLLYIQALASVLHSHHLTEDEMTFPYFRDKLPVAPFDQLSMDHKEIVKLLGVIKNALDNWEKNVQPEINRRHLENMLIVLNEIWMPHIQVETDEFIVKADALLPMEERIRLVEAFTQHGVQHSTPLPITVPFLLYNLPPAEREIFSRGMPVEVVQQLVPVVWKAQWEAMQPFFLE